MRSRSRIAACRPSKLLGKEGHGFAPMQLRLSTRRVQIASWCVGLSQRALDMICEYAPQRTHLRRAAVGTPGDSMVGGGRSDADSRVPPDDLRRGVEDRQRREARTEASMIKVFGTEMATDIIDQAMQTYGAMGMTKEMPLQLMASTVRAMRIYEGPSEVHRWVIARQLLGLRR